MVADSSVSFSQRVLETIRKNGADHVYGLGRALGIVGVLYGAGPEDGERRRVITNFSFSSGQVKTMLGYFSRATSIETYVTLKKDGRSLGVQVCFFGDKARPFKRIYFSTFGKSGIRFEKVTDRE